VFAVDSSTRASRAYNGLTVTSVSDTRPTPTGIDIDNSNIPLTPGVGVSCTDSSGLTVSAGKSLGRLVDGHPASVTFTKSTTQFTLDYRLEQSTSLSVYFKSCETSPSSPIEVHLEHGSDVIESGIVNGTFGVIQVDTPIRSGILRVRMTSLERRQHALGRKSHWNVLATTDPSNPYPVLPDDVTIRMINATSDDGGCGSTTVTWFLPTEAGPHSKQRYCLYAQKADRAKQNACLKPRRRRSQKVACKMASRTEGEEGGGGGGGGEAQQMVQTVRGLKPGRKYAFDVYAIHLDTGLFRAYRRFSTTVLC